MAAAGDQTTERRLRQLAAFQAKRAKGGWSRRRRSGAAVELSEGRTDSLSQAPSKRRRARPEPRNKLSLDTNPADNQRYAHSQGARFLNQVTQADIWTWIGVVTGTVVAFLTALKLVASGVEYAMKLWQNYQNRKRRRRFILYPTVEEMAKYGAPLPDNHRPDPREFVQDAATRIRLLEERGMQVRAQLVAILFAIVFAIIIGKLIYFGLAGSSLLEGITTTAVPLSQP